MSGAGGDRGLRWAWLGVALLALGAAAPAGPDARRMAAADGDGEWLSYGKGYAEQRFSPLTQVNADNVGRLGLAWWAQFDTDRGQEATPLMVDGALYTSTAWSKVFAFDARTGRKLWSYDPKVNGAKGFDACCDVANRGVAAWGGKVFVGALDGRLIALDAKTGGVAWSVQTTDPSKPYTITGAPRVIKGKVVIGNGGAEYGVRGYVTAYDADSGRQAWRFYLTPNPTGAPDGAASDAVLKAKAQATWSDGYWKRSGGGGTAWDAFAYDPKLDLLYVGTGNGSPWNHRLRSGGKGDNLFLSSILALRPDTGEYVWHYQTTPGESWDYTATQQLMLADLKLGGRRRHVLMQAPKNGFFYVLDAATGELLSAKPFEPQTWATAVDPRTGRPIETPGAREQNDPGPASPTPLGAHNWQPMAMSPQTGLVYIPAQTASSVYAAGASFTYRDGHWNTGYGRSLRAVGTQVATPAQVPRGELLAWDPVAQAPRWRVPRPSFWNGGVLATGGGLVFQGGAEGRLEAYAAADGRKLWSYDAQNGILAAPMAYMLDGEQYVAVMAGAGGAGALSSPAAIPRRPGRLLVFKLGATAQAAAYPPPPPPAADLTRVSAPGDATHGGELYAANCQVCHGAAVSGTFLPDLRHSAVALDASAWKAVIIDGAYSAKGMAGFSRFLSPAEAEDVRAYVVAAAKAPPSPPAVAPAPAHAPTPVRGAR